MLAVFYMTSAAISGSIFPVTRIALIVWMTMNAVRHF